MGLARGPAAAHLEQTDGPASPRPRVPSRRRLAAPPAHRRRGAGPRRTPRPPAAPRRPRLRRDGGRHPGPRHRVLRRDLHGGRCPAAPGPSLLRPRTSGDLVADEPAAGRRARRRGPGQLPGLAGKGPVVRRDERRRALQLRLHGGRGAGGLPRHPGDGGVLPGHGNSSGPRSRVHRRRAPARPREGRDPGPRLVATPVRWQPRPGGTRHLPGGRALHRGGDPLGGLRPRIASHRGRAGFVDPPRNRGARARHPGKRLVERGGAAQAGGDPR